jgi:ABC-type branched-subunit amino acid transport system permease subunit
MAAAMKLSKPLTALVWAALLLAPLVLDEWRVSQLAQLLTYGIFALSLAFIWGQAGILCFGQAIFFGIGAYVMALVTLGKFPMFGASQWTGMLLASATAGVAAALLGLFLFRGRGLSGAHFAIVTLGYDVLSAKLFAFTVSGGVAGLAGALFTAQFGFVSPPLLGFALSTEVLIWVAVGGRGVLLGALLGAILVRTVENTLSDSLGEYWLLAMGLLFIVIVVFAPEGLFGRLLRLPPPRRLSKMSPPARQSAEDDRARTV